MLLPARGRLLLPATGMLPLPVRGRLLLPARGRLLLPDRGRLLLPIHECVGCVAGHSCMYQATVGLYVGYVGYP